MRSLYSTGMGRKRFKMGGEESQVFFEDEILAIYQQFEDARDHGQDLTIRDVRVPRALVSMATAQGLRGVSNAMRADGRLTHYALDKPTNPAETVAAIIEDIYLKVQFETDPDILIDDDQIVSAFWKRIQHGRTDIPSRHELDQENAKAEAEGLHGGYRNHVKTGQGGQRGGGNAR